MTTLLRCTDVALAYEGVRVASDISFPVEEGDYLCIVGENGSGKSSLIKAILGLIKPVSGTIEFDKRFHRREIGYLPQQTQAMRDFPASVYEVVLSGTLNRLGARPFYGRREKELALRNLALLGVDELAHHCYHDLSGGQQQRVLLARALCATQKLLVLDEPAAGLDPVVTGELYRIVRQLNRESGLTVIMVSHDLSSAVQDASHILHLHHEPLYYGSAKDYRVSEIGCAFMKGVEL